jgi:glucose-1-phosphate thymidylyltransferase
MKGVILAGGTGSRLHPLTKTTNKHLLPVYDKPMITYPLATLKNSGIDDVLIISGPGHAGQFLELLGSGYDLGLDITYTIQEKPLGIGHGIWVATREFARDEPVAVVLGDNIIADTIESDIQNFDGGAKIFLKQVDNPGRFGIADVEDGSVRDIVEKPDDPPSDLAITGLYIFDENAHQYTDTLEPSERGEVEVTALIDRYLEDDAVDYRALDGYWYDAGTVEGLYEAGDEIRRHAQEGDEHGSSIVGDI